MSIFLLLLKRVAARQDRSVEAVATGRKALESVVRQEPSLVLLDLGLPDISGLDVLAELQRNHSDVAVIVITGESTTALAVQSLKQGASEFLTKPVNFAQLEDLVSGVLSQRRRRISNSLLRSIQSLAQANNIDEIRSLLQHSAIRITGADHTWLHLLPDNEQITSAPTAQLQEAAKQALHSHAAARCESADERAFAVPITVAGSVIGAIAVGRGGDAFSSAEKRRLTTLAAEAGLVLDRAMLNTKLKGQIANLARAQGHLNATERLRGIGRLATGYAHELQGPIQVLQSFLRDAEASLDAGELDHLRTQLRGASDSATRIQSSVSDLSLIGRTRGGIDVGRLVALAWRAAGARGQLEVREDLCDASVHGSPGELVNAVGQVLHNAILAAAQVEGGTVAIHAMYDASQVTLSIVDTGPGMELEVLRRAQEPFFSTQEGAGGLGLAMATEATERMGGTLVLHSSIGVGTRVEFTLPGSSGAWEMVAAEEEEDDELDEEDDEYEATVDTESFFLEQLDPAQLDEIES